MSQQNLYTLAGQVEHTGEPTRQPNTLELSALAGQVEYTGAAPEVNPDTLRLFTIAGQIEHVGGVETLLTGCYLYVFAGQVEYQETYSTVPLLTWSPRILVDLFANAGVGKFSTDDVYIEEL